MGMFHCYVSLPEGTNFGAASCELSTHPPSPAPHPWQIHRHSPLSSCVPRRQSLRLFLGSYRDLWVFHGFGPSIDIMFNPEAPRKMKLFWQLFSIWVAFWTKPHFGYTMQRVGLMSKLVSIVYPCSSHTSYTVHDVFCTSSWCFFLQIGSSSTKISRSGCRSHHKTSMILCILSLFGGVAQSLVKLGDWG